MAMKIRKELRNETVLVTGGSGFVGGWAIARLLLEGYRVRTTIRSLAREAEVRATIGKEVDPLDRLSFYAADLLKDDGWDEAAEGVDYILHVASPTPSCGERHDVVRTAREGTLRVLKAAEKAGVKRVVMTSSSQTAMPTDGSGNTDETVWTDLNGRHVSDYIRSKTLAEQDAWAFMAQSQSGMTLSTVLPAFIQGPVMGKDLSRSLEIVSRMLTGKLPLLPRLGFSMVDVRDLVSMLIKAMQVPEAAGQRFIAASGFLWMSDVASILREHLGPRASKVPVRIAPDLLMRLLGLFNADLGHLAPSLGKRHEFSSAKAERMLGWQPRPASKAIIDGAESLIWEDLV